MKLFEPIKIEPIWAVSAYSIAVFILFAIGVTLVDYPQMAHPHNIWLLYVIFNGGTIASYYFMKHWFMYELGNTIVKMVSSLGAIYGITLMLVVLEINKDVYLTYVIVAMASALYGGIKGSIIRKKHEKTHAPTTKTATT